MIKINKTDKEIIYILKNIFQLKLINPLESDDNMRLWLIRSFFMLSIISLIVKMIHEFLNNEVNYCLSQSLNFPIAMFFTLLFLHINNKLENTSLIIFILTWLSFTLTLFL